jgi:hypothetical protein
MSIKNLKSSVERLQNALIGNIYYENKDSNGFRSRNYQSKIKSNSILIEKYFWENVHLFPSDKRLAFADALSQLQKVNSIKEAITVTTCMDELLNFTLYTQNIVFKIPSVPKDIIEEIHADIYELEKCYNTNCYRSAVILCGRLIEVCLHRKYFEVTGVDLLEKSPGIGLGKLIAKLTEKGIQLDPGLAQQIHLVNNVRTFSVHKKQRPFNPNHSQTQAIVIYTLDILEKLF